MPLTPSRPPRVAAIATAALLGCLASCSVFKSNIEAQAVIDQNVVGSPVGDFFDKYGRPRSRSELPDGTTQYDWISSVPAAAAGPVGLDDRTCTLRIIGARNGRIASALVVLDNPGRESTSRCAEMFKAR